MNFIYQLDASILLATEKIRNPFLNGIMAGITWLGNWEVILALAIALGIFFWKKKKYNYLSALFLAAAGGELIGKILKYIVARQRPEIISHLAEADGFSFPSGHAFMAACFYGFLIWIFSREIKNDLIKKSAIIFLLFLIFAIGFSRIYLGVHCPSDVLGGFVLGTVWVVVVIKGCKYICKECGRNFF